MSLKLNQNPRSTGEKVREVENGRVVRGCRRQQEITIAELSGLTGISISMLSKIESSNTSPSLTNPQTLANALSVPTYQLFPPVENGLLAVHMRAGEGVESDSTGSRANHQ